MKLLGSMLLLIGLGSVAFAQEVAPVPEIDATSAVTVLCLISGAVLVARGRRKK
jgi:hypothetical protein